MKLDELLELNTKGTTIDPKSLRPFAKALPNYLGWGLDTNARESDVCLLNITDYFEFHLRRYLLGYPKTLHRVFMEVRLLISADTYASVHLVCFSINSVRQVLLKNEWYELLIRLQAAEKKILKLLPDPNECPRSAMIDYLDQTFSPDSTH